MRKMKVKTGIQIGGAEAVLKRHGPAKLRIPTCRMAFGNVGSVCVHAQTHTEHEKSSCKAHGMDGMAG